MWCSNAAAVAVPAEALGSVQIEVAVKNSSA
jgi:hypothetical protein